MSWFEDWYNGKASINPVRLMWDALPQNVRDTYTSGARALMDMSAPASIRDYTTSAQDTARSAAQGDGWGTATNALATVNAALGAIPVAGMGVRAAQTMGGRLMRGVGENADTTTGWVFKGLSHPNAKMDRGDWRKFSQARDSGDVLNVELPLSEMYATQPHVNANYASVPSANTEAPMVIKKAGEYYLTDGHHRAMAAAAEGKQTVPVRLVDIDGTTQRDFPLLEILRKYGLLPVAGAGAVGYGAMQQPEQQPQGLF